MTGGLGRIIAYSGTHGTGKSTAVYELAADLKKRRGGEVGVILETARACPFAICAEGQTTSMVAQRWIFSAQLQAELYMIRRYPITVSDRSVVDCIGYTAAMGAADGDVKWTEVAVAMAQVVQGHMDFYEQIIFRSVRHHDYLCDDGLRHQDWEFRQLVEEKMLRIYAGLGVDLINISALSDGVKKKMHRKQKKMKKKYRRKRKDQKISKKIKNEAKISKDFRKFRKRRKTGCILGA